MLKVILFHNILQNKEISNPTDVKYSMFKEVLKIIADSGVSVITLKDAWCKEQNGQSFNGITLAFDDGWLSHYEIVLPELMKRKWKASFYVISSFLEKQNYLNLKQVKEMFSAGMEIGSHSHTHPYLSMIPDNKIMEELKISKQILEELLGEKISSIAFPYGDYNKKVIKLSLNAGYDWICTSNFGSHTGGKQWQKGVCRNSANLKMNINDYKKILFPNRQNEVSFYLMNSVKKFVKKSLGKKQYIRLRKYFFGMLDKKGKNNNSL